MDLRLMLFRLILLLVTSCAASPFCRCYPGECCWPSTEEWSEFNATVSGRLVATVPIGSVCHSTGESAAYNKTACANLISNWGFPATHYETTSSPMTAWFANFSCDPFLPDTPCTIGALQRYAVSISGAEDVRATLQFAQQNNIRVVIRNTGHDYLGKSTAPGALALWMHHLKNITHSQYVSSFYNGSALRLGAGVQGFEAMAAAHVRNQVVLTGNCESIGVVGGFLQGGGHSQLASRYGLAADQVLEWEVVTADGELLTASPNDNADLYWALAGGGGGTFAVVLSATVKTYPEMVTAAANLTFSGTHIAPQVFWDIVQNFVVQIQSLTDLGAVAIWAIMGSTFSLTPVTLPGGSRKQLDDNFASTLELLNYHNVTYDYHVTEFDTFWDTYAAMNPRSNITEAQLGGRLMPRTTVESNVPTLMIALRNIADQGAIISGISLNVSHQPIPSNAVNRAWRKAGISFVLGIPYNYTSRYRDITSHDRLTNVLLPRLAMLSPRSGSYLNEGDWNQSNWQEAFYGDNYRALEAVKAKYDPDQIFWARTAVGSEKWVQLEDGHLCQAE